MNTKAVPLLQIFSFSEMILKQELQKVFENEDTKSEVIEVVATFEDCWGFHRFMVKQAKGHLLSYQGMVNGTEKVAHAVEFGVNDLELFLSSWVRQGENATTELEKHYMWLYERDLLYALPALGRLVQSRSVLVNTDDKGLFSFRYEFFIVAGPGAYEEDGEVIDRKYNYENAADINSLMVSRIVKNLKRNKPSSD